MKKAKIAKQFLEELSKTPIISVACNKLGVSRQTIYKWKNFDHHFYNDVETHQKQGIQNINDLARSKIITHVNNGDLKACKYWLEKNDRDYSNEKLPDSGRPIDEIIVTICENKIKIDHENQEIDGSKEEYIKFFNDLKKNN